MTCYDLARLSLHFRRTMPRLSNIGRGAQDEDEGEGVDAGVRCVLISPRDGSVVACGRQSLCVWSVNGTLLASVEHGVVGDFTTLQLSQEPEWLPDEPLIISGHSNGCIRMWTIESSDVVRQEVRRHVHSESDVISLDNRIWTRTVVMAAAYFAFRSVTKSRRTCVQ